MKSRMFVGKIIMMVLVSLIFILWNNKMMASTYYVSTNGSNSNTGTQSSPWLTIQYGVDNLTAGDTLLVESGTYNERVLTDSDGEADNVILISAMGTVIMRGFEVGNDYIIVEGFSVNGISISNGEHCFNVTGNYCQILNNTIQNVTAINVWAIQLESSSSYCLVKGNLVKDVGEVMGFNILGHHNLVTSNELTGINYGDLTRCFGHDNIISNNYYHDCEELGSQHLDVFQTFSQGGRISYNNIFERNFVKNIEGQMFMIEDQTIGEVYDITFRNNVYINVSSAGQSYARFYYYNNTTYHCGWKNNRVVMIRHDEVSGSRGDASGSQIINNIFSYSGTRDNTGFYSIDGGLSNIVTNYNLVFQDINNTSDAKRDFNEPNGINGNDPLFVDVLNDNLQLQPGSPAINSGMNLEGFNIDKDGNSRPDNQVWDIGAYENSDGQSQNGPSAPANLKLKK